MNNQEFKCFEPSFTLATSFAQQMGSTALLPVKRDRKGFYAPEFDILRFGAFMLVFCRHVGNILGFAKSNIDIQISGALKNTQLTNSRLVWDFARDAIQSLDFGVCLFFFLSSFLITRLLLIEKVQMGRVAVGHFYIRRCLRIWPLYFAFLLLILIISKDAPILFVSQTRLLAAAVFVANWAVVLHGWSGIAIQPLWSVSVEEQFYLVWPLSARLGKNVVIGVSGVSILTALGMLIHFGMQVGSLVTQSWPNTFVQILFLGSGALTACLSSPESRIISAPTRSLLLVFGLSLWLVASVLCHIVRIHSPGPYRLVIGYLLVLAGTFSIFTGTAGWARASFHPRLIYLGKLSYGLYVFHSACLLLTQQFFAHHLFSQTTSPYLRASLACAAGFLLTVACSLVSYHYLESPFLKLKECFSMVASRPI